MKKEISLLLLLPLLVTQAAYSGNSILHAYEYLKEFVTGANRIALFEAAKKGDSSATKQALQAGVDVNSRLRLSHGTTVYYVTPLHFAAQSGNAEALSTLLTHGALVNTDDDHSNTPALTPLHLAAQAGDSDSVRVLLKYRALVNARDVFEKATPLHRAIDAGHTALAKQLIDAGADVNSPDRHGSTPLHWAAKRDNLDGLILLLTAGAWPLSKDIHGKTPLDSAKKYHASDYIVAALQEATDAAQ